MKRSSTLCLSRREFMRRIGAASCAAMAGASIQQLGFAEDGAAASERDLFISVFLRGGCDGLHILAPVDDPAYRGARASELRVADRGNEQGMVLAGAYPGREWRLHSAAAPLHELYEQEKSIAFIHACGLKNGTRSHFDAQAMMERGIATQAALRGGSGWLARLVETLPGVGLLTGLSAGGTLPDSLQGTTRAAAIESIEDFNYYGNERQARALRLLQQSGGALGAGGLQTLDLIAAIQKRLPKKSNGDVAAYVPAKGVDYPDNDLSGALKTIARLAKMEVGLQAAALDYGDWDTHTGQEGRMKELLENLSKSLRAFCHDLHGLRQRWTVVVMSEFGRRLKANESGGTDHGHGNLMLVLGPGLNGGRCFGTWPGLANDRLDEHADLAITTDYRQILCELMQARMRGADTSRVFPDFRPGDPLKLTS